MRRGAEVEWQTKLLGQRQNRRRTAGLLNESFRWVLSRWTEENGEGLGRQLAVTLEDCKGFLRVRI